VRDDGAGGPRGEQQTEATRVNPDVDATAQSFGLPEELTTVRRVRGDDVVVAAYEAHHRELYSFIARSIRYDAEAEDLLQETFLRLTRDVDLGRRPDQVRAWLYRVATNLIVSRSRRRSTARRWLERFGRSELQDGIGESPESGLVLRERSSALEAALADLAADARLGLLLAGQGFSGREIAEAIGRSEGATRTLLCRARLRLREVLDEGPER
jgi:RNA polymerase sigma factor (sigma-70 family)